MLRKLFGNRLKQLRLQQGLTQDELAYRANVPDSSTIRRWEKGKEVPKFDRYVDIARALGVRVRDLFDFPDSEV